MKRLRIVTGLTAALLVLVLLLAACGGTGGGNDDGQNTQETADEQETSKDSGREEIKEETARVLDVKDAEHLDGRIDKTFTISDDLTMTVEQIMTTRDVFPSAGEDGSYSMGDSSQVYFDVYIVAEWTGKDGTDPAEVLYVGATNRETGEVIGCIGYYPYGQSNIIIGKDDAEVGYWLGKPYWNRGLCTEALQTISRWCFKKKKFLTLWGDYFEDNPASGRVLAKCGFRDTGELAWLHHVAQGIDRPVRIMRLDRPR